MMTSFLILSLLLNAFLAWDHYRSRYGFVLRSSSMGFGPVTIGAGKTVQVDSQSQVPFRPVELTIPTECAHSVNVNDIKVGNMSQLPGSNPIPGDAFVGTKEVLHRMGLTMDTAQIAQTVSLSITNKSQSPIQFQAALLGKAACLKRPLRFFPVL